ncbi:toxin-antitoxin system YwqK family antitoxin [Akkermansiaceae bacterium]|nr:toxin-antitoxin system YwqK family antitoxin [Akkermansiaceae bacterium]MDB4355738.1 toxin-antitoxin system YwqK family antitoxin [Akkermansiaceae bacterium]
MKYSKLSNKSVTGTMKHLLLMAFAILTIGCGEKKSDGVNVDELELRNDITYLRGADTPFTGKYFILNKNGKRQLEVNLKDGQQGGLVTEWYEDGQKKSEGNWKNGQEEGLLTAWYKNGQRQQETTWKDGKSNGLATYWYQDGQKKAEGNWKDGKKEGPSASWHENGQKMENATYKKGKPDGRSLAWHENGQMKSETNWKNGQIDGTLTLWHKNGKKMLQGDVKGGKHISNQFWNSKGEEVDSREEAGLNGPLFEALGGVGFAYYTMKMNEDSFKAIAIPVEGLPTELCEDWEAAFHEVLSNEAILQEIADETQYAEKLGVPSEEAVSHLKEAIKVRFVKRNNWIEIGLVGKRKQNEDLMKIAELLHERGAENVVKKTPSFQQYLDELNKQKAKGKKEKGQ